MISLPALWSFPPVSQIEQLALEKIEMYLEGRGRAFESPALAYHDVIVNRYEIRKDYAGMFTSGCSSTGRRSCMLNYSYKIFLSYQADGELKSGTFQLVYRHGDWEVIVK
jgi:hypothetical protein